MLIRVEESDSKFVVNGEGAGLTFPRLSDFYR